MHLAYSLGDLLTIVGMHKTQHIPAEDFFRPGSAEHPRKSRIDVNVFAVAMHGYGQGRKLDQGLVAVFAFAQRGFNLSLLPAFDDIPLAGLLDQGELMVADHVDQFVRPAFINTISADGDHPVIADHFVDCRFVIGEILPILLFQPKGIARQPKALVTAPPGVFFFIDPALQHPIGLEFSRCRVPLAVIENFYLAAAKIIVQVGHGLAQRRLGLLYIQRLGSDPHAELILMQTLAKIRHQDVDQILFCLIELAKMRSPRHIANNVNAGSCHDMSRAMLASMSVNKRLKQAINAKNPLIYCLFIIYRYPNFLYLYYFVVMGGIRVFPMSS